MSNFIVSFIRHSLFNIHNYPDSPHENKKRLHRSRRDPDLIRFQAVDLTVDFKVFHRAVLPKCSRHFRAGRMQLFAYREDQPGAQFLYQSRVEESVGGLHGNIPGRNREIYVVRRYLKRIFFNYRHPRP